MKNQPVIVWVEGPRMLRTELRRVCPDINFGEFCRNALYAELRKKDYNAYVNLLEKTEDFKRQVEEAKIAGGTIPKSKQGKEQPKRKK